MALGAVAVLLLLANAAAAVLQPCVLLGSDRVAESCDWQTLTAPNTTARVVGAHPFSSGMPVVVLPDGTGTLPPTAAGAGWTPANTAATPSDPIRNPPAGFTLVLRRVVLANAVLAPLEAAAPVLWPLGLFSATAAHLAAADVRLAVSDEQLQQHLRFFAAAGADIHTDNTSFVHIPDWSNDATSLRSVTLLAGACRPSSSALALSPAAGVSYSAACGVRTVDNATLVPTLLRDAAVSTPRPLLVLVAANVSLGAGLAPGAIAIRRPLVLVGLFSRPTSVNLGMVVNQLNASCPAGQSACYAAVFWHSLVLENAAPGDAISSIIAPPYSSALSANIWALYCNRTMKCLRLQNTTTVLATAAEMDYVTYMYSMFESALPSMRQVVSFYHTDLHMTTLKFHPGPGDDAITITNMTSDAWSLRDGIWTTQAQVAPRLPVPGGLQQLLQATRAGPLVQAVDSCSSLQAALQTPSSADRMRVWMLLSNISLTRDCWPASSNVQYTTQIFGQLPGSAAAGHTLMRVPGQQQQQNQQALAEEQVEAVPAASPVPNIFTLGFGFVAEPLLQLPQSAVPDQFLRLQNLTLAQLPQGPDAARAAAAVKYQPGETGPTPAEVWTILLWPVSRPLLGSAVYMADVQLMVPQPEFDYIAHLAASASAFVVQLQNSPGLTFTFTTVEGNAVRIGAFQGHGIAGQNVWLLPDPAAAASMQQPYAWPFADSAASANAANASSPARGSQTTVLVAGVVAGVGSVALLLLGLAAWWLWRRHQEQEHQRMLAELPPAACKPGGSTGAGGGSSSRSSSKASSLKSGVRATPCGHPGDCISVSVCQLAGDRCLLCDEQLPADARHSRRAGAVSSPDQGELRRCCTHCAGDAASAAGSDATSSALSVCIGQLQLDSTPDHVAAGLQRWRSAVSSTTLQLMERRMGGGQRQSRQPSASSSASQPPGSEAPTHGAAALDSAAAAAAAACSLQILDLLGQGSFGCVYLANWRGKRVAVKVMQLPANALLEPQEQLDVGDESEQQLSAAERQRWRRARQLQQNSPPHMAIMEAVVSSTMSHPNVVQVFTYMLNPLTAGALPDQDEGGDEQPQDAAERRQNVSGWELKLVMEYCDQGTLRDALDCRKLHHGSPFLAPALVLSLAHDVAAAMLHLHSEGIVHGDLKAANVMLTRGGQDPGLVWAATVGHRLTAKVADFGLAMPLHPNDTHATMAARGRPTHMSPELFMSGHVSRASDVFA